jgi:SAM-dependent methyltransferase
MKNYYAFSKFYDSVMGDRKLETKRIETLIRKYNPKAKTILELACGTGSIIYNLSKKGFAVSGVDISESTLDIARQKIPRKNLYHQNIINFKISKKFDVILCVFDSINHLLKLREWEKTIQTAHLHLNSSGIFIFDINTESKLKYLSSSGPNEINFGNNNIIINILQKRKGIYNWNIKIFEGKKSGECERYTENINERSFPLNIIKRAVKKIFGNFTVLDFDNNKVSSKSHRLYFVCFRN